MRVRKLNEPTALAAPQLNGATPVTDTGWITDEVREFVANDFDHHHITAPAEVADVIGWLCSAAGRIVTGNIIRLR